MSASLRSESSPPPPPPHVTTTANQPRRRPTMGGRRVTVTSESLFSHIPLPPRGTKNNPWLFPGKKEESGSRPANVAIISSSSWGGKGEERRKGPSPTFQAGNMGVEHANSFSRLSGPKFTQKKIRASWRNSGI